MSRLEEIARFILHVQDLDEFTAQDIPFPVYHGIWLYLRHNGIAQAVDKVNYEYPLTVWRLCPSYAWPRGLRQKMKQLQKEVTEN